MQQHYELMFIVPGSVSEDAVPAMQERVLGLITEYTGTVTSRYNMERQRLAYPIKQQHYGYYYVAQFDMEADKLKDLDTKLRLDNEVLRYLLVKADPKTDAELQAMLEQQKPQEDIAVAATPDEVDDVAQALPTSTASVEPTTTTPQPVVSAVAAEVAPQHDDDFEKSDKELTMEELDKKLDEILDDNDLASKL